MEDIRKRDQENLKREKEWKDEMMRKGANRKLARGGFSPKDSL